jgi:DNA polymerase-3 subunit delta
MAVVRSGSVEAGLRRLDPNIRVILFYGADEAKIRQLAMSAVRRVSGSLDDPFNVQRLGETDLGKTPGRLMEEVQSLSLLGGKRVVWVEGAEGQFLKAVEPVLASDTSGNLIVAEAGNLAKSSPLRSLLEASEVAWIVPVYEPSAAEAQDFLQSAFAAKGLSADAGVGALLLQSYGSDLGLLQQEVEKLSLYCLGAKEVTVDDVEAVCASAGEVGFDDLVDAALRGDLQRTEELLVRLAGAGQDIGQVAGACLRHVVRLQEFHLAIERGQSPDQALRGARPAIFFKRLGDVQLQLRIWDMRELTSLAATLADAIRQGRTAQALAATSGMRSLLSVAHRGQVLRARLN